MTKTCPLGHQCGACLWHTQIRGVNPQTGQEIDQVGCAVSWLPMLLIENAQQQRQTAASVDAFRDHMLESNNRLLRLANDPG